MAMKALFSLVVGFVLGILLASLFELAPAVLGLFFTTSIAIVSLCLVDRSSVRIYIPVGILIIGVLLGAFRYQLSQTESPPQFEEKIGQNILFEGIVTEEPDVRDTSTRLNVLVDDVDVRILVIVNKYPEYKYGERIRIDGRLGKPGIIETDGGVFNWGEFLAKDNIEYVIYRPKIEVIEEPKFSLVGSLIEVKLSFMRKLQEVLPEPHASLEAGLILGAKQSLGTDLLDQFRRTGLIHMVVLSGQNLSIVSDWVMRLLSFLPLYSRLIFGAVGLIFFTLMTGGQAATVRAAIMALVSMLARATGRPFVATIALVFAGVIMLLWNPKLLVFDTGFQLSFLATLGLIYLSSYFEEWLRRIPKWKWLDLRGIISATLSAQVAVAPWILYKLGTFSIVSLPANFLVLPVVPLAMAGGFISGSLAYISNIIALPFSYITYWTLSYMLFITKLFAQLSFASIKFTNVSIIVPSLCYAGIILFIIRQTKKREV